MSTDGGATLDQPQPVLQSRLRAGEPVGHADRPGLAHLAIEQTVRFGVRVGRVTGGVDLPPVAAHCGCWSTARTSNRRRWSRWWPRSPTRARSVPVHGQFTVTRSGGDLTRPLAVLFAMGGSATNCFDYICIHSIVIPANQAAVHVPVTVLQDTLSESAETVFLNLMPDPGYVIATPSAVVTIANGPPPANAPPSVNAGANQTITLPAGATLAGKVTDDGNPNPPHALTLTWSKLSGPGTVTFNPVNAAMSAATFSLPGTYVLRLTANDSALSAFDDVTITVNAAPTLDPTVVNEFSGSTAFLYQGPNPIQTGVVPGTITPQRAAVIRGNVRDRTGAPLAGARISILNHPQYGQTFTRADGNYDLAVNGGGKLVVRVEKAGYFEVQRDVIVPWRDFVHAPDVVLIAPDVPRRRSIFRCPLCKWRAGHAMTDGCGHATRDVDLPAGHDRAVPHAERDTAAGAVSTHHQADRVHGGRRSGRRRCPPSCRRRPATRMRSSSMPTRPLPRVRSASSSASRWSSISRTSAVWRWSARARGLLRPAGRRVEGRAGWTRDQGDRDQRRGRGSRHRRQRHDRQRHRHRTERRQSGHQQCRAANARDVVCRRANAVARADDALHSVRHELAVRSAAGCGATERQPRRATKTAQGPCDCPPCEVKGSIIECGNQTLGESIPIVGTGMSLNYRSDRVPGRLAANTIDIPLTGATVPASLAAVESGSPGRGSAKPARLRHAAGQSHDLRMGRQGRLRTRGAGTAEGAHSRRLRVPGGLSGHPGRLQPFLGAGERQSDERERRRQLRKIFRDFDLFVGAWDARGQGLGGWSLSDHHVYDFHGRVLYLGSGERRRDIDGLAPVVATIAGNGVAGPPNEGGVATASPMVPRGSIAVEPDGGVLFMTVNTGTRLLRLKTDGTLERVAGSLAVPTPPLFGVSR